MADDETAYEDDPDLPSLVSCDEEHDEMAGEDEDDPDSPSVVNDEEDILLALVTDKSQ
jgi:hypothetical protein